MIYKNIIRPILFCFDGELVHLFAMSFLNKTYIIFDIFIKLFYSLNDKDKKLLKQNILNISFSNPVGLGAGFDKNGDYIKALNSLGFGFLELGTITPKAQKGNIKPRLFRLKKHNSLQNAMGFNNLGHKHFLNNLSKLKNNKNNESKKIKIGINIGKNKNQKNALDDYKFLIKTFDKKGAYITINISSPNTKGLRDLQNGSFIKDIFTFIKNEKIKSPIFLKISPDMAQKDALNLCKIAIKYKANAIIISNTTLDYSLCEKHYNIGGISGELLGKKAYTLLKFIASNIDYKKTILISSGGISNANEAYRRIKAGASLVQIYSSFIYNGLFTCVDINKNLAKLLQKDGYNNISQAIGCDIAKNKIK